MNKLLVAIVLIFLYACGESSKTYYMDSIAGDNANSGMSEVEPWKSLDKLNQQTFKPGDKILFKSGTEYIGQFEPKGSGEKKHPIVVDQYTVGDKPILHGVGEKRHTILLENIQYWELNNLEVTNLGLEPAHGRTGITIIAQDAGDIHHIYLRNLIIRDVNGSCVKHMGAGSGIYWESGGNQIPTRFVDLLINNCKIFRCQCYGISGKMNTNRAVTHPKSIITLNDNFIEQVPGDGIISTTSDGLLLENNVIKNN